MLQREQIERWATAHGHLIAVIHEEFDESGGRADRPKLLEMIDRVEARDIDGVVVAKLDRFGRSLIDGLAAIERIGGAGGTFVSVQDGLDLTSDTGKLVLRIMLSMAEWELDRIRSTWDDARRRATDRGMHLAKLSPAGYLHGPDRRLVADPAVAPHITEVFVRRGAGATLAELGRYLDDLSVPTARGGKHWTSSTLIGLLRNRVYVGELRNGAHLRSDAHEALVDEAMWQAAQSPRLVGPRFRTAEPTLATGLARCANCGMALEAAWRHGGQPVYRNYRCKGKTSAGQCPGRARAVGWELEHLLEEAFFTLARQRDRHSDPDPQLTLRLQQAEAALAAYRDHPTLLARLGADRFDAGLATRVKRVERAALAVANDRVRRGARRASARTGEAWERDWPTLTIDERRQAIGQLIEAVFIAPGTSALTQRAWVCARGRAPFKLPRRGPAAKQMVSFDPQAHTTVTPRPAPPWPTDRVTRELSAFVDTQGPWPSDQEFLTAGRGPLLRQIDAQGGQDAWARRIGMVWSKRTARRGYWTDDRIRASITEIMRNRTEWPYAYEWVTLAPGGLGHAIEPRHRWWAEQFGYPVRRHWPGRLRWTPERIASTVSQLAATTGTYPTQREFVTAGLGGLELAIRRRIGHRALAAQLNLKPSARTATHWRA